MSTPQYPGYGQDPYGQRPGDPYAAPQGYPPAGVPAYPGAAPQPAAPHDPYAAPSQDPYGVPSPYGQPQQDPYAQPQDPYAQPQDPYARPQDPYAQPQQDQYGVNGYGQPDPFAAAGYPQAPAPAQPQAPAPLPGALAEPGKRVGAFLIDMAVNAGIALVLGGLGALLMFTVDLGVGLAVMGLMYVALLAWFLVYSWMQGGKGSIGAKAMKIRIASADSGAPIGFGKALLRNIVLGLTGAVFALGYFSILFDKTGRRQGWHDKAVGAVVLDARSADPAAFAPESGSGTGFRSTYAAPGDAFAASSPADPYGRGADPYAAPSQDPYAPADPYAQASTDPYAAPDPYGQGAADPYAAPSEPAPSTDPYAIPANPYAASPAPASADPAAAPSVPPAVTGSGAPEPSGDGLISFVPGITQDGPVRRDPVPPMPEDDLPDDTVIVQRGGAAQKRFVLVWDDDIRHAVTGRTVFGRNPSGADGVEAVAVRDETLSLSKTHFEIDVDGERAWLVDRHSTNGVTIMRGGERIAVTPGERTPLEPGDALEMGDRIVTIEAVA